MGDASKDRGRSSYWGQCNGHPQPSARLSGAYLENLRSRPGAAFFWSSFRNQFKIVSHVTFLIFCFHVAAKCIEHMGYWRLSRHLVLTAGELLDGLPQRCKILCHLLLPCGERWCGRLSCVTDGTCFSGKADGLVQPIH